MQKNLYILTFLVVAAIHCALGQRTPADTLLPAIRTDTVYLAPAWQKTGILQPPVNFSVSATSLTTCISQPVTISLTIPERSLGSMLIFSVPQNDSVRTSLRQAADNNNLFLLTTEAVKPGRYSFSFILLAANITLTQSVTVEAAPCSLSLIAPEYNCRTGSFVFRHMGGDTSAVSYMAVGITSWSDKPGPFTVKPACDAGPFTLMARSDSDPTAITTFAWNYTQTCPENCPPTTAPPSSTTVTPVITANPCASPDSTLGQPLRLLAPVYDCSSGVITFRITGGSGGQVSFMSPAITGWTTNCQTNIQNFALIADIRDPAVFIEPFMLFARELQEDGSYEMARLRWDPKTACGEGAGRTALSEQPLLVEVAGNPVYGNLAEVVLDGLQQEPVQLRVVSLQGQVISEQAFPAASGTVRTRIKTGQSSGIYLIQAFTPTRRKSIRIVKQ
ncbi:T9SS type A sorting domain-containing protein [Arsenicibacter rosenii]|uniref:Secretion system C-terminal sorting domain-containing protein n=1 Tax=Arsenicibacter rosenii TaxID=1750698 RepID=A0A1S2VLX9_9BACT|nr:T9SS type A sorting domain-containing protein [Arsenicibacter rosenii]OIN58808.1 hypothetical protein BLX24_11275 [Arsenicibacter rosenii]